MFKFGVREKAALYSGTNIDWGTYEALFLLESPTVFYQERDERDTFEYHYVSQDGGRHVSYFIKNKNDLFPITCQAELISYQRTIAELIEAFISNKVFSRNLFPYDKSQLAITIFCSAAQRQKKALAEKMVKARYFESCNMGENIDYLFPYLKPENWLIFLRQQHSNKKIKRVNIHKLLSCFSEEFFQRHTKKTKIVSLGIISNIIDYLIGIKYFSSSFSMVSGFAVWNWYALFSFSSEKQGLEIVAQVVDAVRARTKSFERDHMMIFSKALANLIRGFRDDGAPPVLPDTEIFSALVRDKNIAKKFNIALAIEVLKDNIMVDEEVFVHLVLSEFLFDVLDKVAVEEIGKYIVNARGILIKLLNFHSFLVKIFPVEIVAKMFEKASEEERSIIVENPIFIQWAIFNWAIAYQAVLYACYDKVKNLKKSIVEKFKEAIKRTIFDEENKDGVIKQLIFSEIFFTSIDFSLEETMMLLKAAPSLAGEIVEQLSRRAYFFQLAFSSRFTPNLIESDQENIIEMVTDQAARRLLDKEFGVIRFVRDAQFVLQLVNHDEQEALSDLTKRAIKASVGLFHVFLYLALHNRNRLTQLLSNSNFFKSLTFKECAIALFVLVDSVRAQKPGYSVVILDVIHIFIKKLNSINVDSLDQEELIYSVLMAENCHLSERFQRGAPILYREVISAWAKLKLNRQSTLKQINSRLLLQMMQIANIGDSENAITRIVEGWSDADLQKYLATKVENKEVFNDRLNTMAKQGANIAAFRERAHRLQGVRISQSNAVLFGMRGSTDEVFRPGIDVSAQQVVLPGL